MDHALAAENYERELSLRNKPIGDLSLEEALEELVNSGKRLARAKAAKRLSIEKRIENVKTRVRKLFDSQQ